MCIRSGYLALREVAGFFGYDYDDSPAPDDPISVTRDEFDEVCTALIEAGVPVHADHDQAWRDFAGWRVNYDRVLITLAGFVMAPYAPWVSDRSPIQPLPHYGWGKRRLRWPAGHSFDEPREEEVDARDRMHRADRVEDLERVVRAAQLDVDDRVPAGRAQLVDERRACSTGASVSRSPCTIRAGGASGVIR